MGETRMTELAEILGATPGCLAEYVFLVSLLVGSFLNVVIHRVPIMLEREWKAQAREMLVEPGRADGTANVDDPDRWRLERLQPPRPRSRCPVHAEITALQNIPVVSWLLLGGKCASCRTSISVRYPIVEFATAVLSTVVVLHFGWHWQTLAALLFTWALISLTVIDLDHTLLPDVITIPLLWLGLLLSLSGMRV